MPASITMTGLTTNGAITDAQTIQPFASVVITDSISGDQVSATIAFAAANGTLSGAGHSAGVVASGTVTYSLSATTQAALQAELRGLIFTPTAHQSAAGTQASTAFNLTVTDATALSPVATPSLLRTLSSVFGQPVIVATDAAGDVFVADYNNNNVQEFGASGALLRTLSNGVNQPAGVATDAMGDVFVANHGANTVEEFDASGAMLRTLSSGVNNPFGVATDAAMGYRLLSARPSTTASMTARPAEMSCRAAAAMTPSSTAAAAIRSSAARVRTRSSPRQRPRRRLARSWISARGPISLASTAAPSATRRANP